MISLILVTALVSVSSASDDLCSVNPLNFAKEDAKNIPSGWIYDKTDYALVDGARVFKCASKFAYWPEGSELFIERPWTIVCDSSKGWLLYDGIHKKRYNHTLIVGCFKEGKKEVVEPEKDATPIPPACNCAWTERENCANIKCHFGMVSVRSSINRDGYCELVCAPEYRLYVSEESEKKGSEYSLLTCNGNKWTGKSAQMKQFDYPAITCVEGPAIECKALWEKLEGKGYSDKQIFPVSVRNADCQLRCEVGWRLVAREGSEKAVAAFQQVWASVGGQWFGVPIDDINKRSPLGTKPQIACELDK